MWPFCVAASLHAIGGFETYSLGAAGDALGGLPLSQSHCIYAAEVQTLLRKCSRK
jgi:hypothetical protein